MRVQSAPQIPFGIDSIRIGDECLRQEPIKLRLVPSLIGSLDQLQRLAQQGLARSPYWPRWFAPARSFHFQVTSNWSARALPRGAVTFE